MDINHEYLSLKLIFMSMHNVRRYNIDQIKAKEHNSWPHEPSIVNIATQRVYRSIEAEYSEAIHPHLPLKCSWQWVQLNSLRDTTAEWHTREGVPTLLHLFRSWIHKIQSLACLVDRLRKAESVVVHRGPHHAEVVCDGRNKLTRSLNKYLWTGCSYLLW